MYTLYYFTAKQLWTRYCVLLYAPAGPFQSQNRQKRSGDHILLRNALKRVLASGGLHPPDTKIKSWIT